MKHRCTVCNHYYEALAYRDGYICEECLDSIKSSGIQPSEYDAW